MNYIAILVAAAVSFLIGFLWHGPLFGKTWMRLANIHPTGNEKLSDMKKQMFLNYLSNVVMAFVLSGAYILVFSSPLMGASNAMRGAICAFWVWLGFVAMSSAPDVIWVGKSFKLWLFELSGSLVSILAMGAIIASW